MTETNKSDADMVANTKANPDLVANTLTAALGLAANPFANFMRPVQVSQTDTIEKNLRYGLISNNYALLSRMYLEYGLVQSLVDTVVDDGFRGGIHIFSKQLEEEQIEKLTVALDRNRDLAIAAQACKWDRLYGGAGIIIVLSDQDPATPLDVNAITKDSELKFQSCNLWELFFTMDNNGAWVMPTSGEGAPLEQTITDSAGFVMPEYYQYYSCKLHHSRLLKLIGVEAPSFLRGQLRGWGASMMESIVRPLNSYLKISDLTFELLDEAKVDVYKIANLNSAAASENGSAAISRRLQIANMGKNFQHAIALDTTDDFDYKNLTGSFTGIAEVSRENRVNMSAALRMPMNKIYGQSSSGFSSGQDDLENYAAVVEGQVRSKVKWHLQTMIELRCQQMYGFVPTDLSFEFEPIRILTSEQEEAVKNSQFNRLIQARERGEITRYEFREACNKNKLLGITVDLAGDELNKEDPQSEAVIEDPNPMAGEEEKKKSLAVPTVKEKNPVRAETSKATRETVNDLVDRYNDQELKAELMAKNTAKFDKASYAASGGDEWTHRRPSTMFEDYLDAQLWARAYTRSVEAYGKPKWEFMAWWYLKHGGKFLV